MDVGRTLSGCRTMSVDKQLSLVGRCFIRPGGRDLDPSLGQANSLAQSTEELGLVVVVFPAAAVIELNKMRTATLSEGAPFLGDRLECICG